MKRIFHLIAPAVVALAATSALAQTQGTPPQQQAQPQRQPPSAETMARMHEGRIAMIKTALKLTDAQLKLWAPVEAQLSARQAARTKEMQDRALARQQGATAPSVTERMERRTARQAQHAEQEKAFLAAFKPFFAALTDEQKPVAERLLGDMHGGGRGYAGHGHGHGHGQQHGMGGRTL